MGLCPPLARELPEDLGDQGNTQDRVFRNNKCDPSFSSLYPILLLADYAFQGEW